MAVTTAVGEAFDRVAPHYDRDFGTNPVGLLFRHVVQQRLLALFPAGSHVLDLGCGTGEDAVALAEQGRRVLAIDLSSAMVERCRAKAAARGLGPDRLRAEERAAEDVCGLEGRFDGAYSDFGALNCADLGAVGRGLERVLRPGAPVVLSLMPARPLPVRVRELLTGQRRRAPKVGGLPVAVHHPTPRAVRALFGEGFAWRRCFALGALMPGPDHAGWAARHPQAFGVLAAVEGLVRAWPLLRGRGDHVVLEGARR